MQSPSLDLPGLEGDLGQLDLSARLRHVRARIPGRLVFTTSFGLEDQALTHAIVEAGIDVEVLTLDTGRLFGETLALWAETEERYRVSIGALAPDGPALQALILADGPLGFRRSVEARQACCGIRKVEPLGRALDGAAGWLTGLRSDQSAARARTPFVSRDDDREILKINPLADWSRPDVERYVARRGVPTNPLHARGFPSIGCAPCTRAVRSGEDERAGRWWWESETRKECGLHLRPGRAAAARTEQALG